ncbi:MAG: hypothetical protein PHE02_04410 [Lachnospiraceae bacterium]|nr:hypothetical protein [Lachnospiraceae bacterium]
MKEEIAVLYDLREEQRAQIKEELEQRQITVYEKSPETVEECKELPYIDFLILGDDGMTDTDGKITPGKTDGAALTDRNESLRAAAYYDRHVINAMSVITMLLPWMDRGRRKRICSLTNVRASNNLCYSTDRYGERMARAARNMMMHMLQNELAEEGYTFRIFCDNGTGKNAGSYFMRDRSIDSCPSHMDENRLVMRDNQGREIPW